MEAKPFRLLFTQPIRGLIARHLLGLAKWQHVMDCAHALLDAGYYSQALGDIITAVAENEIELNRRLETAIDDLLSSAPDLETAIVEFEATYIITIAESGISPYLVVESADHQLSSRQSFDHRPLHLLDYSAPMRKLLTYLTWYEDPDDSSPEIHAAIDDDCIAFATEWTRSYFQPVFNPGWLTPTVQSIAAAIYQDRAFDRLPILADALEEAGCTNADVLLHCRQPSEHVRGCWVVDLVLGKK